MSKNDMIAFGTQFRGYNKADVNAYIEKKSRDYAEELDKCDRALKEANDKLEKQTAELARMCSTLSESDKIIVSQKNEIDALKKENAELAEAFTKMRAELDDIESLVHSKASARTALSEHRPEQKKQETDDDEFTLSAAIKTIKNKLAKFLK